jgi:hypothetical protein
VQRAINRSGKEDFWDLAVVSLSSAETRECSAHPRGDHRRQNPAQMALILSRRIRSRMTRSRSAPSIFASGRWTGTSIDEIQSLNLQLRRWTTPVSIQPSN